MQMGVLDSYNPVRFGRTQADSRKNARQNTSKRANNRGLHGLADSLYAARYHERYKGQASPSMPCVIPHGIEGHPAALCRVF